MSEQPHIEWIWDQLYAAYLPEGRYNGHAWGDMPAPRLVNALWKGKTFTDTTVINHIAGLPLIKGNVSLKGNTVYIHYPRLGLTDELRLLNPQYNIWLGRMALRGGTVWFTLEKEQ